MNDRIPDVSCVEGSTTTSETFLQLVVSQMVYDSVMEDYLVSPNAQQCLYQLWLPHSENNYVFFD